LRTAKAVAERLSFAEADLARLVAQGPVESRMLLKLPGQIETLYLRLVASLEAELSRDVQKARTILRRIVGSEIPVKPHPSGKHLVARIGLDLQELVQAVGGSEIFVVAGARFELYSA